MTAPDSKILAEAIKRSEADMQLFRGIDDPEIKKLVEFSEVILVAAKAYGPMREALEKADHALTYAIIQMERDFLVGKLEATQKTVRAALSKAGV